MTFHCSYLSSTESELFILILLSKYINNPSFGSVLKEQHVLPLPLLALSSSEPPWQPAGSPTEKWCKHFLASGGLTKLRHLILNPGISICHDAIKASTVNSIPAGYVA